MDQLNVVKQQREPWNKGKLVGQKPPSNSGKSGLSAYGCSSQIAPGTLPFSTWPSTAS